MNVFFYHKQSKSLKNGGFTKIPRFPHVAKDVFLDAGLRQFLCKGCLMTLKSNFPGSSFAQIAPTIQQIPSLRPWQKSSPKKIPKQVLKKKKTFEVHKPKCCLQPPGARTLMFLFGQDGITWHQAVLVKGLLATAGRCQWLLWNEKKGVRYISLWSQIFITSWRS